MKNVPIKVQVPGELEASVNDRFNAMYVSRFEDFIKLKEAPKHILLHFSGLFWNSQVKRI